MKNIMAKVVRVFAFIMFFGGILMGLVSRMEMQSAEVHEAVYGSSTDIVFWKFMIFASVLTVLQSIFVYAFSYIVEASVKYIKEK